MKNILTFGGIVAVVFALSMLIRLSMNTPLFASASCPTLNWGACHQVEVYDRGVWKDGSHPNAYK